MASRNSEKMNIGFKWEIISPEYDDQRGDLENDVTGHSGKKNFYLDNSLYKNDGHKDGCDGLSPQKLVPLKIRCDVKMSPSEIKAALGLKEDESAPVHDVNDRRDQDDSSDDEEEEPIFHSKYINFVPLYQDYCLSTIRDEVTRFKQAFVPDVIKASRHPVQGRIYSFGSGSDNEDVFLEACSARTLSQTSPCFTKLAKAALWQDLEEVKTSGLLSILTPAEIKLQESMFELFTSELSYLKSLKVAVDHFYSSQELRDTISKMDHLTLFSNICHLRAANTRFLKDLETRLGENLIIFQVGDVVIRHSKDFQRLYVPYVTNMSYQDTLINQLQQNNQDFAYVMKKLERDPVCERQTLKSFLALPFQKITRYELLLEHILKMTEPDSESALNLKKAIHIMREIVTDCNRKVEKIKQLEEMIYLETLMDFGNFKSVRLITSTRHLIRHGSLKRVNVESGSSPKLSYIKIHLHLFNDLLTMSSKKFRRFSVLDYAPFPENVSVRPMKAADLGIPPNSFLLHCSWTETGSQTALVLVAQDCSEKEAWLKALSSQHWI